MSPVQIIPDSTFPSQPSLDRAHTAGVEHRFGQMGLNNGLGLNHRMPAPAYSMPQQQQSTATAHHPSVSQHTGYAQNSGISLESPIYQSYKFEKVKMKNHKETWALADRRTYPMTPQKMKERVDEYKQAFKSKKASKVTVNKSTLEAHDNPNMNSHRREHIKQLVQDLAYHDKGPSYIWSVVYIKLVPEPPPNSSNCISFIVIMRGDRRQGEFPITSVLKYPLEARIDISDSKRKDAMERASQGLRGEYEYPWPKQQARPGYQERNAHPQSWAAPERLPTQPHWAAQDRDHGQPEWTSPGRAPQHPSWVPQDRNHQQSSDWATPDRGNQQPGWAAQARNHQQPEWTPHDGGHQQSTWKAQENVPAQPSQPKVQSQKPVPIVQLNDPRQSYAEGGHPKAQSQKPVPIVQLSDSRDSYAEGGHPKVQSYKATPIIQLSDSHPSSTDRGHSKTQTHRPTPIIELGNPRPSSNEYQRRRDQAPASPSASDSSFKTQTSRSSARTDQTPDTIYTVSETGATTSGSRRSSKTARRPSYRYYRTTTRTSNESSPKHRPDVAERERSYREHSRRDPTYWGMKPKVGTDDKTRRGSSYSRRGTDTDEVVLVRPASSRDNRHKSNRRKSRGGHREHTRYYDDKKSSSHHRSAERPRQSSRRDRSPSVSSHSSDSYGSSDDFEDVFEDDDVDSMDPRSPYTREPRERITPRFSDRRDSTYAWRERNAKSERGFPIIVESKNKGRHERRREQETGWY